MWEISKPSKRSPKKKAFRWLLYAGRLEEVTDISQKSQTETVKMLGHIANALGVTVEELKGEEPEQKEKPSTAGEIDLSGLSPEDAELVNLLLKAPEAKKNAIRALL